MAEGLRHRPAVRDCLDAKVSLDAACLGVIKSSYEMMPSRYLSTLQKHASLCDRIPCIFP